jgi:hypothetical protein
MMEEPHTATQDFPGRVSASDRVKAIVSDVLRSGANAIVENGQGKDESDPVTIGGQQASVWLTRSADYVEHLDLEQLTSKIQRVIRTHPGVSLLMAGAAGLIIGSLIRRR